MGLCYVHVIGARSSEHQSSFDGQLPQGLAHDYEWYDFAYQNSSKLKGIGRLQFGKHCIQARIPVCRIAISTCVEMDGT
jgi:hypothetical protein